MGRSLTLALKDIKLLIRDKAALFWVLVFPLMIAILFGSIFGGSNGSSAIKVAILDEDGTEQSKALAKRIDDSDATDVLAIPPGAIPKKMVQKGDLTAYVVIPKGYGQAAGRMQYSSGPAIKIALDPSHKAERGMLEGVVAEAAYQGMSQVFAKPESMLDMAQKGLAEIGEAKTPDALRSKEFLSAVAKYSSGTTATGSSNFSFEGPKVESIPVEADATQPSSAFEVTFPQAILWAMLGVMSSFAISMVRERTLGTLVRLRVSPMSFTQILAGKGLACFLTACGVMVILLILGKLLFHIRLGSPMLLALAIGSGAFCLVGIMMLLSVMGKSEQAVAGSSWGVMITMAMFGGGMIPLFVMPKWMQTASNFSPLKWTTLVIEGAIFRGFTLQDMLMPCGVLIAIGAIAFAIGVRVVRANASSG